MKMLKNFLRKCFVLAAAVILLSVAGNYTIALANEDDMSVIYMNLPGDWEFPHVWAWDDDGNNAFAAWPGGEAEPDTGNEGWYFIHLPASVTNIIISASDGLFQTDDHQIESLPAWVTVRAEFDVEIAYEAQTVGELPEYIPRFVINARVPDGWDDVNIWAWVHPEGINAFETWPGTQMRSIGDWHSARVPYWVNSIIINANAGEVQTEDLTIEAAELWVVIEDDLTAEVHYDNPDLRVDNIIIRAQVPSDWGQPHLWAWSHPDGTNAFPSWPGEPLTLDGGWYMLEVPGWINSVIVNANDGAVQTGDMRVDEGMDIWILVADAATYVFDYAEITDVPEASEEIDAIEEAEMAEEAAEPAETAEEIIAEDIDNEGMGSLVIGIVVAAGAAIVTAVVVARKKQSK